MKRVVYSYLNYLFSPITSIVDEENYIIYYKNNEIILLQNKTKRHILYLGDFVIYVSNIFLIGWSESEYHIKNYLIDRFAIDDDEIMLTSTPSTLLEMVSNTSPP